MQTVQKKWVLFSVALVLVAAIAMALVVFGNGIFASSFADNPANVLDGDDDYAVLKDSDITIVCPPDFNKIGQSCEYNGVRIRGWLIDDFTPAGGGYPIVNRIDFNHSDFNLNCSGFGCTNGTQFEVFTTPDLGTTPVVWTYRASCSAADRQRNAICVKTIGGSSIEGVLVGRSNHLSVTGDPAIHFITMDYNATQCSNGIDDDNDSNIDFPADAECANYADNNESG